MVRGFCKMESTAGTSRMLPMATPSTLSHNRWPNLRPVSRKSRAESLHTK